MAAILTEAQSENNDSSSHYSDVVGVGKLTLKVIILINGVASLSLMTLIGSILSSGRGLDKVNLLTAAIFVFGFGVLSGAIAVAEGYRLVYYKHESDDSAKKAITKEKRSSELRDKFTTNAKEWSELHLYTMKKVDMLVKCSFTLFGIGIILCTLALLG